MFMNDVQKKEEIRNIAIQDLRRLGIKYRPKKNKCHVQERKSRKVFKVPLQTLSMQTVTLSSGQQLIVPKLVHEMCSYVLTKVCTEGLFRKGGSKSRQNEIKLSLDAGCHLGEEHHEIDVASVLKTFFRELPEPLFPLYLHDTFLRCVLSDKNQVDATLLVCLLLPCEHLNTLSYFMQFLYQVSEFSMYNKMDAYNLAVVIGPTLMPVDEKMVQNTARVTKICQLFKLLIENANRIGVLPSDIIERVALSSSCASLNDEEAFNSKKKKKRRSGSLTRMFNGLKKIVGSKAEETPPTPVTPDLLMTPSLTKSAKKRKVENGFSAKKRKEILHNLPQKSALSTPFTPLRTPVCINPNPKKRTTPDTCQKPSVEPSKSEATKEKKIQWYMKSKSKKREDDAASLSSRTSVGPKSMLERRWSAVSQVASFKRNKKRNSCAANLIQTKKQMEAASEDALSSQQFGSSQQFSSSHHLSGSQQFSSSDQLPSNKYSSTYSIASSNLNEMEVVPQDIRTSHQRTPMEMMTLHHTEEPDYVRISKTEYEEIKYRVSAIERRISLELDIAEPRDICGSRGISEPRDIVEPRDIDPIENVVTAYKKTLVQSEPLSPTTDQLARRFSRDLKIRRSAEQKVFRSPSARRIGGIRRRSRELERQQSIRLSRNQSWHVTAGGMIPRATLKRGRPNTVLSGLIKTPMKSTEGTPKSRTPTNDDCTIRRITRSSSFQDKTASPSTLNHTNPNHNKSTYNSANLSTYNSSTYNSSTNNSSTYNTSTFSSKNSSNPFSTNASTNSEKWTSAEGFFNSNHAQKTPVNDAENCRSSIAKLRNQNAGMVLAKARLFDELADSDSSNPKCPSSSSQSKPKTGKKIGSLRHADRQAYRVRTLRAEDRRAVRKSMSPRRRGLKSPTNRTQKLQLARVLQEQNKVVGKENLELESGMTSLGVEKINPLKDPNRVEELLKASPCCTPNRKTTVPNIKKSLTVKSPKRLHRTPLKADVRKTPLKAVTTPRNNHY